MRRLFIIILMSLYSLANAETLVFIGASENGKSVVDVDSVQHTINNGNTYISSAFKFYRNDGKVFNYVFTTKIDSCKVGNGELIQFIVNDDKVDYLNTYWWSNDGGMLYDRHGSVLCVLHEDASGRKNIRSVNPTL